MSGLAWPAHDVGPTPPPEYVSRARDDERTTRKKMAFWDRTKFLLLFFLLFLFFLANTLNQFEGIITLADGLRFALQESVWLLLLAGAEVLRQVHYLISEHWSAYHLFWTRKVFGGVNRRLDRMNDWNRFRLARAGKWLFMLVLLDLVIAADHGAARMVGAPAGAGADPAGPAADLPARVRRVLPDLPVRHAVLVPVQGRRADLLPRRHQDPLHRRVGPGQRPEQGQGEHGLPRGPGVHREARGLRAWRHPAVGSSRNRQDAHGGGGRR